MKLTLACSINGLRDDIKAALTLAADCGSIPSMATDNSFSISDLGLTPKQVAFRMQVGMRTLERLRAAKEGPPFTKIGKRIYYPVEAYFAWVSKQQAG